MNSIDYVVIAIVAVSAVLGLYWGIIRQIISIVGLIAGIAFASRYGPNVADWLSGFITSTQIASVLGFIAVLVGVSALASLIASLLHRFAGLLFLGWADHLAGAALGALQGALLATVLIAVLAASTNETVGLALRDSHYAAFMVKQFGAVLTLLPESLRSAVTIFFGGL